jgi:5-methylcytosine-specific restriction endonuclease McrA
MQKVFVVDRKGNPCLPCHPARARKLLKEGKAKLVEVAPFTIQLNRIVDNPVGSFTVGIDDGAKNVGLAVVNEYNREVVFTGTIKLRQDVAKKILQRRQYRRTRRNRKVRHREARFDNRKQLMPPPSIRTKKESILRVVADMKKRINITKAVVEQGQFDISSLSAGKPLEGIEYQHSDYEGANFREKVLWRDGYTCQKCGGKDNLQAHHIRHRSNGGTNTVSNGVTLCEDCHKALHEGLWQVDKKPKQFKYHAHLQVGKWYLYNRLKDMGLHVSRCFGWMTKKWREMIGLAKSHANDAISMVCKDYSPIISCREYFVIPRRKKIWDDNPTKTCDEKNGFRHWDLVKAIHRTKGSVIGSIRSLKKACITIRTKFSDNFPVSYTKTRLLYRFNGLVYI